jgi:Protein of unknown function (DUF4031)
MIMVDELRSYPQMATSAQARRHFGNGRASCHLTTDGELDELHAFAARIGLLRAWFQEHPVASHYDLTPSRRARALAAGAVFVPMREQLLARRAKREAKPCG